jgi:hypothetical protein
MAAAVSDYRPIQERLHKIESGQARLVMEFMPTQDILQKLKDRKGRRLFVGFALETKNEVENGRRKLVDKGLDLICVNNPLKPGSEFGSDTNIVTLVHRSGRVEVLPRLPKYEVAVEILRRVDDLLKAGGRSLPERRTVQERPLPRIAEPTEEEEAVTDEIMPEEIAEGAPEGTVEGTAAEPASEPPADSHTAARGRTTRRGRRGGRRRRTPGGTGDGRSES